MMMNKKTLIAAAALTVLLTACGGNGATEESKQDTASSVASEAESIVESNAESVTEAETEAPTPAAELEDNCISWDAIKVYFPGYFEEVDFATYSGTLPNGQQGYFLYDANIYHTDDAGSDFTEKDVPEILDFTIYNKIEEVYPCYEDRYSVSVETEEATEVLGCPFIYRTGVIHTEDSDESADLHYAAYYGVVHLDVYDVEKAPVCWMAFSESDDAETLAELETIVKNAAEKAEFEVY